MSCELPPFTLLRTEHGNVIARDNRDNQEFVFAECYSTAIAALILAAVTLYTERKAYEKDPAYPAHGTVNNVAGAVIQFQIVQFREENDHRYDHKGIDIP